MKSINVESSKFVGQSIDIDFSKFDKEQEEMVKKAINDTMLVARDIHMKFLKDLRTFTESQVMIQGALREGVLLGMDMSMKRLETLKTNSIFTDEDKMEETAKEIIRKRKH